jgi:hypothetical protein
MLFVSKRTYTKTRYSWHLNYPTSSHFWPHLLKLAIIFQSICLSTVVNQLSCLNIYSFASWWCILGSLPPIAILEGHWNFTLAKVPWKNYTWAHLSRSPMTLSHQTTSNSNKVMLPTFWPKILQVMLRMQTKSFCSVCSSEEICETFLLCEWRDCI